MRRIILLCSYKMESMKVGQLKKMLREVRAKECPPIAKMKKAQVIAEIGRVKEDVEVKQVAKREKAVKQLRVVEAETKARNVAKKEAVAMPVAASAEKPKRRTVKVSQLVDEDRMVKGSAAAKEYMANIRKMKK